MSAIVSQDYSQASSRRRRRSVRPGGFIRRVTPRLIPRGKMTNKIVPSAAVHAFHRTMESTFSLSSAGIQIGGLTSTFFSVQFNLYGVVWLNGAGGTITETCPGAPELVQLFDNMMLNSVKMEFRAVGSAIVGTVQGNTATIGLAIDTNDATVPVTSSSLREYETYKTYQLNENSQSPQCTRYIKPCYTSLINYTTLLSGYKTNRGFVKSDYDIPHYGLKGCFTYPGNTQTIVVSVRYNFLCKNVK